MRLRGILAAVFLTGLSAADARAAGGIALPRFFDPPPPRAQIADAQVWDPYPVPDIGAGPADSARPRDFQYPPPEATRGRIWQGAPGTFPRQQPWLRSQAPVDYPNIKKRWVSSRRTAPLMQQVPSEAGPDLESPRNAAPGEEDAEVVPAPSKNAGAGPTRQPTVRGVPARSSESRSEEF